MVAVVSRSETIVPDDLESDAARFYEVVDGQIVENPPMGASETLVASFLQGLLDTFARSHQLGRVTTEMLFLIDRARSLKRRPDLAFVSNGRWPFERRVPRTETWEVVPDLAVEIVSKTNTADAVVGKVGEYFRAGVRRVWVIYPAVSEVYVYDSATRVRILRPGDDLEAEDLLPGFRVPVATLFAEVEEGADDLVGDDA